MQYEVVHVLFGADRGGCELNAWNLMRSWRSISHRVIVLGPEGPMCRDWRELGAEVGTSDHSAVRGRAAASIVRQLTAGRRPDAAVLWHGMVQLPQLIQVFDSLGVPVAVHGGNPAHTMPRWVDWKHVLLGMIYQFRGPLPTYICCSQYVADSFETSRYLRRFPRIVVQNGVELPAGAIHEPRDVTPERPAIIGMVARLNSIKDHATLLRALVFVRQVFRHAKLELAGDGDERDRLVALANELNLTDAVTFLGDVGDVYERMAGWDLFAYATTENEGLGNAVAEAMMFGLPCVLTDVGPMHEFSGAGDAVRLTPPNDPKSLAEAISALIPDVEARRSLSLAGQRHALANFHPETFAQRYAEILGFCQDPDAPKESSYVNFHGTST